MTRHYASSKPPARPEGDWLRISSEMTWAVEDISERDDLVVKIAPDAGYGDEAFDNEGNLIEGAQQHPGVTFHNEGIIEINGQYIPEDVDLSTVHPLDRRDRARYPVTWGVLTHEASHADYTRWTIPLADRELSQEENSWAGAALLLEESRIEARHIHNRPQDQPWLQASATGIALAELKEMLDAGVDDKAALSRTAALILGRLDAGSVDPSPETDRLREAVTKAFGTPGYRKMRGIWREAHETADDDTGAMLALGRRWYELTGDDGGQDGQDGQDGQSGSASKMAQELSKMLSDMAEDAQDAASGDPGARARRERDEAERQARASEGENQQKATREGQKVFTTGRRRSGNSGHPVTGYRPPTPEEMSLARRTRRALQNAYTPERAVTVGTSVLPPGRLLPREARQGEALASLGLPPTREPFLRKERRRTPVPPLKVGIIQDVSGSQQSASNATAIGAWALAEAASGIADAQVAMAVFGDDVHPVFGTRDKLPGVPKVYAGGGTEKLERGLLAIEGELQLARPGTARLLVVLTDGVFTEEEIAGRDPALKRLVDAGVHVLWLVTDGGAHSRYLPDVKGVRVYTEAKGKYNAIPEVITAEAVNTLKEPVA